MDIDTLFAYAIAGDTDAIEKLAMIADHLSEDDGRTILHIACINGNTEWVQFIVTEFEHKDLLVKVDKHKQTALHLAAARGYDKVVEILIDAAIRNWPSTTIHVQNFLRQATYQGNTALHHAVTSGDVATVEVLVNVDPNDRHIQNLGGYSPVYLAAKSGYNNIVKIICNTCTAPSLIGPEGTTALHAAISQLHEANENDKDIVKVLMDSAKRSFCLTDAPDYNFEALLNRTDQQHRTLLSLAVLENHLDVVKLILKEDPAYERVTGSKKSDLKSLIPLAPREGHKNIVKILCEIYEAGRSGQAGHILLIDAIKEGDKDLSCVAVNRKGQNILHIAVVQSNKYMIQSILAYCPRSCIEHILNAKDDNGNTPLHLLISHGCFLPELIKHSSVNVMAKNNQSWTPSDMLYFQEEVTADQVKIKKLLDDTQATQQKQFWRINIRGRWNNLRSSMHPNTRLLKDIEFGIHLNEMMVKEHEQMKEKIKPYRERTTTQIIVTALITTVTFTVGFTMPGGYHQSGEPEEGLVLLSKRKALEVFMVSDASALALSITSLFIYFISSMYDDPDQVSKFDVASTVLNIVSVIAMILTFIAGIYVVLSHSPGLALIVCIICSTFFFSISVLLIKMMSDYK